MRDPQRIRAFEAGRCVSVPSSVRPRSAFASLSSKLEISRWILNVEHPQQHFQHLASPSDIHHRIHMPHSHVTPETGGHCDTPVQTKY